MRYVPTTAKQLNSVQEVGLSHLKSCRALPLPTLLHAFLDAFLAHIIKGYSIVQPSSSIAAASSLVAAASSS